MISPREAMIYTSECVVKPSFGNDYFGRIAAANLDKTRGNVFSDGGFEEEVDTLVGFSDVYIARIHRAGCSFGGDSRRYLQETHNTKCFDFYNNSTIEEVTEAILEWVNKQ